MTAQLYLIRGIPGSGKTTLAKKFLESGVVEYIVAADDFMVDEKGEYSFDPKELKECHRECLHSAYQALSAGINTAVHNTFTRVWEMQTYLDLGYPVTVIRCEGDYGNTHGVPDDVVSDMLYRFEDY